MAGENIVVWMNQPSHYQSAFFRELASRPEIRLTIVYGSRLPGFRRELGWDDAGSDAFPQHIITGFGDSAQLAWKHRRATHMINGVWSVPAFVVASMLLLSVGSRVFFHAERPNPATERTGVWRWLKRGWLSIAMRRARGLFVIGSRAGEFYTRLGVSKSKIIPFMYFSRPIIGDPPVSPNGFVITYVGQFIARKRVGDLINALQMLRSTVPTATLLLVGHGPLRDAYGEKAASLGLYEAVKFLGPLHPTEVQGVIARSSVLVLPSEFDGWGITVNEALQGGVPAVCSDACGAAELLEANPTWGIVFRAGEVQDLVDALHQIAGHPEQFRPDPADVEAKIGVKAMTDRFLQAVLTDEL